jgi:hypothetical protein
MTRARAVILGVCIGLILVVGAVAAVSQFSTNPMSKSTNPVPKSTTALPRSSTTTSTTVPRPNTTVPKSTTPPPKVVPTYVVPTSILDDCSADVTIPLWSWLNSLPQPGPGVVQFQHSGCYLINGSLDLRNWQKYTLDGNGSTLEQTNVYAVAYQYTDNSPAPNGAARCATPGTANTTTFQAEGMWGPCTVTPYPDGRAPVYCGSSTPFGTTDVNASGYVSTDYSTGRMVNVEGGCDLTFRNFNLVGSHGTGTDSDKASSPEQDALVQFNGTQRVLFTDNTLTNPWGDWVSVFAVHEAPDPGGGVDGVHYPSTDVTITYNDFAGTTGREGISVIFGSRVDIGHNTFANAAMTMFDLEWDAGGGCECDVNIHDNMITGGYAYLIAAFTGAIVRDFAFTDNTFPQMKIWMKPPNTPQPQGDGTTDLPHEMTITGNTATQPAGWPQPDIFTANIYNVLIAENSTPLRPFGVTVEPFVQSFSGLVTVRNNDLRGIGAQPILSTTATNNTQCNNTVLGAPADGATCASGYATPTLPTAPALPRQ